MIDRNVIAGLPHSLRLFEIACLSRNRATVSEAQSPNSFNHDVSIAIVMAAASVEGLINELAEVVSPRLYEGDDPRLIALGLALREIEDNQGKTSLKYQVASFILSGRMLDMGANPYQDFEQLFRIRNQHMHLAVVNPSGLPKVVRTFRDRGLTRDDHGSWMYAIQTPKMAAWACRAASNIMIHILDLLPVGLPIAEGWKETILDGLDSR